MLPCTGFAALGWETIKDIASVHLSDECHADAGSFAFVITGSFPEFFIRFG